MERQTYLQFRYVYVETVSNAYAQGKDYVDETEDSS